MLKHVIIYLVATFFHATANYVTFGIASSLGTAGKTGTFLFKALEVVGNILWLPLGLLQNTKLSSLFENYTLMLILNSLLAVGMVYFIVLNILKVK